MNRTQRHHRAPCGAARAQSPNRRRACVRLFTLGQALFVLLIALCVAYEPSTLAVKRGLSFYGTDLRTVVPYTTAFAASIILSAAALRLIHNSDKAVRQLRRAVATVVALMIPIPLTPYNIDIVFDWIHIGASFILFGAALLLGIWLTVKRLPRASARALLALEVAAGVAILTAQTGLQNYMLPSELTFQLAVATLIVLALRARPVTPSSGSTS